MRSFPKKCFMLLSALLAVNLTLALVSGFFIQKPVQEFRFSTPQRLLVFAPHIDDETIQAGGAILDNTEQGGVTKIVYLTTDSREDIAIIRERDATRIWEQHGRGLVSLEFHHFRQQELTDFAQAKAKDLMANAIGEFRPDVIIYPLKEGGHVEHDIVSDLVSSLLDNRTDIISYSAALYNPYFLMRDAPIKTLGFFVRILPLFTYYEPNSGLLRSNQKVYGMTDEQLRKKIDILKEYSTEQFILKESQFGHPDLFDSTDISEINAIKIGTKYFSPWATFSLVVFSLWLVVSGYVLASSLRRAISILLISSCATTLAIFFQIGGFRALFDEGIGLSLFGIGVIVAILNRHLQEFLQNSRGYLPRRK